jgi:hypothetical protein
MDIDGFMRALIGLNRYMTVDESIVTIGIIGISGIKWNQEGKQ